MKVAAAFLSAVLFATIAPALPAAAAYEPGSAAAHVSETQKSVRPAPRASRAAVRSWGVPASAWTGRGYSDRWEWTRGCIVKRESMGQYNVVDPSGRWFGAYQFDRSTGNTAARRMGRSDLVGTTANHWARRDQDRAFWTIWNNGRGMSAWAGGRWSCGF
jgi:hypothetical protein